MSLTKVTDPVSRSNIERLWKTDPEKAGEDPFLKMINSGDGFETLAAGMMALLHGISIIV
jgi:hypothetical protein